MFATKVVRDLNAKVATMETAGEAAWGVALQRETVIRPLAEQPILSAESVAEAARQLGRAEVFCTISCIGAGGGQRPLLYSHGTVPPQAPKR